MGQPSVEVRFENLTAEAAVPSVLNGYLNILEVRLCDLLDWKSAFSPHGHQGDGILQSD